MKKNTLYLIGAAVILFFLLKKKGSAAGVGNPDYLVAESGAILMDMPYGLAPLYNFKGGEKLTVVKDLGDTVLVEFTTQSGNILSGQVEKSDIVNIK